MDFTTSHIIIASGPVIVDKDEVLLNRDNKEDLWKFMGGKVKEEDFKGDMNTLEHTAIRRVKEESGIDIEILCPLKPLLIKKPGSDSAYVMLIHFLSTYTGDIQSAPDQEFQRFNINKVLDGSYVGEQFAPNVAPLLENVLELRSKGIIT